MSRIKILIVDDSASMREVLRTVLSAEPDMEIVGVARNGKEAVAQAKALRPDFITMDINMPVMGGIEAIEQIMPEAPAPILVITSVNDSRVAFEACAKGAMDVFPKSGIHPGNTKPLTHKIRIMSKVKVLGHHIRSRIAVPAGAPPAAAAVKKPEQDVLRKVVAIACSTGGPKALSVIFSELPPAFPYPIVVAQHIVDGFVGGLVSWLSQITRCRVEEGREGAVLTGGKIYLSPSEQHMEVSALGAIHLVQRKPTDVYQPCCDILLSSVAKAFGKNSIGVILTGMADDGVQGLKSIKAGGGHTLAQDEATSVVFGMNSRAIGAGCVDKILPLQEIGRYLGTL